MTNDIREQREAAGLSQEELATELGVSQTQVSAVERLDAIDRRLRVDVMQAIRRILRRRLEGVAK